MAAALLLLVHTERTRKRLLKSLCKEPKPSNSPTNTSVLTSEKISNTTLFIYRKAQEFKNLGCWGQEEHFTNLRFSAWRFINSCVLQLSNKRKRFALFQTQRSYRYTHPSHHSFGHDGCMDITSPHRHLLMGRIGCYIRYSLSHYGAQQPQLSATHTLTHDEFHISHFDGCLPISSFMDRWLLTYYLSDTWLFHAFLVLSADQTRGLYFSFLLVS